VRYVDPWLLAWGEMGGEREAPSDGQKTLCSRISAFAGPDLWPDRDGLTVRDCKTVSWQMDDLSGRIGRCLVLSASAKVCYV
jgi:hypothetical protein